MREQLRTAGTLWVGASEPAWLLSDHGALLAGVRVDGTGLVDVLGNRAGQLASINRPVDIIDGPMPDVAKSGKSSVAPASELPPARQQFGLVLSATRRSVFVIGGLDASTNKLMKDVWRYDHQLRRWSKLPVEIEPERVMAATYRAQDRCLYVIDRHRKGWCPRARLLRIHTDTGATKVLGRWPKAPLVDRVFLSNGPDGELIIVGSSSWRHRLVGVVLEPAACHGVTVRIADPDLGVILRIPISA